jgi:hypothetical protein
MIYTGLKVVYGFCDECFGALHLEKSDLFMSFRFAKGYKCFGALHLPKSVNHFQLSILLIVFKIWWLLKRNFRQLVNYDTTRIARATVVAKTQL